jgi:uncharacterized protein (DUF2235 family)
VRRLGVCLALALALAAPAVLAAAAEPSLPEEEAMERWIVICLDGTWNNAERGTEQEGGRTLFKPTNVLKVYRALLPVAPDGTTQIAYYNEGVGAFVGEKTRLVRLQTMADRVFGGGFGGGFEGRVKEAYRFLVGNYRAGDRIAVFGFSRGAAQARSLVRFIDWTGGLLAKEDEYYIPELFGAFGASSARPGAAAETLAAIRARGSRGDDAVADPRPVAIDFLGVWDTVLSVGSRLAADHHEGEVHSVGPRYAHHVGAVPPPIVRVARQALAIDEARWDFRPHVWRRPAAPNQSLEQLWFPGVHTNVGGGRMRDGMGNVALHWMAAEAREAGLRFDEDFLRIYRPWFGDERGTGSSTFYRRLDRLRGKSGRGVRPLDRGPEAGLGLHESALKLLLLERPDHPPYRPANLLDHLAAHPQALDALGPDDRRRIEEMIATRAGGRR